MSRMGWPTQDALNDATPSQIAAHCLDRLRECLFEVERHEDRLARVKRRWFHDQARKAGVDADDPATAAGLSWAWRKTAIAQDIVGDIKLWADRTSFYASVHGAFNSDVRVPRD